MKVTYHCTNLVELEESVASRVRDKIIIDSGSMTKTLWLLPEGVNLMTSSYAREELAILGHSDADIQRASARVQRELDAELTEVRREL